MNKDSRIYVTGANGLVGSAILRKLQSDGYTNIITRTHKELDLTIQNDVKKFFNEEKPEYVFLCAARVGGIKSNSDFPVEFIMENLQIQTNVFKYSYENNVKKLLFLGSSCIYPRNCQQPIKEEYLLTGELEKTNEPYAIAKIAGIKMCQTYNKQYNTNYISVMPTNLFGIGDNFDLNNSHVLPALLRKIHEAKINNQPFVEIWGTGEPKREFLFSCDLADACLFLMQNYNDSEIVNIGTNKDVSIKELVEIIKEIVGYKGELKFDSSKPDGTYRKLLDVSKINNLGWKYKTELYEGIQTTYQWYLNNINKIKGV